MDPQLIVRAQQGDERAFAEITAEIGGRLNRATYGILDEPSAWSRSRKRPASLELADPAVAGTFSVPVT
jgi:hypothetical protein